MRNVKTSADFIFRGWERGLLKIFIMYKMGDCKWQA